MTGATDQRRLTAIMFTDMVGFSALSQRDEKRALLILEEQRAVVRATLPVYGGHEIKTAGDGFLISFASALEAVRLPSNPLSPSATGPRRTNQSFA
jgi:adenylate cyclase